MAAAMDVDPEVLLFTQDSIARKFREPYQDQRIDDTVDSILAGKKKASDFPRLEVVPYEGRLWSLDNRRLWVFRKASVPTITVNLVGYNHHSRFADLIENKPELKLKVQQKGYWPDVRGRCRKKFPKPVGNYARPPPPPLRQVYVVKVPTYGTGAPMHPINRPGLQAPENISKANGNCAQLPAPSSNIPKPDGSYARLPPPPANVPKPNGNYARLPAQPPPSIYIIEKTPYSTGARVHPISTPPQQVPSSRPKPHVIIQVDQDGDGDASAANGSWSVTKGLVIATVTVIGLIILGSRRP